MSTINFIRAELALALTRGVRQCVLIAERPVMSKVLEDLSEPALQLFAVAEDPQLELSATLVHTHFGSETLAAALEKSNFDKVKASLFVWFGGAGYRTLEGVISSLAFIASLPKGSGVVFDYAVQRVSPGLANKTALDGLASRMSIAGDSLKYLIQPQAVGAMLRGIGFRQILDLAHAESRESDGHLVSAVV